MNNDCIIGSFNTTIIKPKWSTRVVYDYGKANEKGLNEFMKHFDFENMVFSLPVEEQAEKFLSILH